MNKQRNQLKKEYRDGSKLGARINLHDLFSTNRRGWYPWVFDQFDLSVESRVLELGSGPGILWQKNLDRIRDRWQITLSDFSPGMLAEARHNLGDAGRPFDFVVVEAQTISFANNYFDAVIANHMLYHVPDRNKVYSEISRILKPTGQLYAATNGQFTMRQYDDLVRKFAPKDKRLFNHSEAYLKTYFSLENGAVELATWFAKVVVKQYDDALVITEAEPLVTYAESSGHLKAEPLLRFREHVIELIKSQGAIHIDKIAGVIVAQK